MGIERGKSGRGRQQRGAKRKKYIWKFKNDNFIRMGGLRQEHVTPIAAHSPLKIIEPY